MRVDLKGRTFGSWTVVEYGATVKGHAYWICRCVCGKERDVEASSLTRGTSTGCGCTRTKTTKHGMARQRLYRIWRGMRQRCYYEKHVHYFNYGGRGITVCDEWNHRGGFPAFMAWALANGYDDLLTLERRHRDDNYGPDTCSWVTRSQQNKNRHRHAPARDGRGQWSKGD